MTENCGYAHYVRDLDAGLVTPLPYDQEVFNAQLMQLITGDDRRRWAQNGAALAEDATIHQMATAAVDLLERFCGAESIERRAVTVGQQRWPRFT